MKSTSSPRLARAAAKVLSEHQDGERAVSARSRAAATSAIRQALAAKAKRKRQLRFLVPAVAAAAAMIAATISAAVHHERAAAEIATNAAGQGLVAGNIVGEMAVLRGGVRVPLHEGERVAFGERVRAEGKATLVFATGTRLDVEPASELVVEDRDGAQVVQLDAGALTASVAKLAPSRRFLVRTSEAEVEVRGTVFRVTRDVAPGCGHTTTVRVAEGRVVARSLGREQALDHGEGWASACVVSTPPIVPTPPIQVPVQVASSDTAPALASPLVVSPASPSPASPPTAPLSPRVSSVPTLPGAPVNAPTARQVSSPEVSPPPEGAANRTPASDLAAQNALFSEAMAAKGRGDASAAVHVLDDLLTRHPRTPLREAALAERMKLLARSDRARAATAAKEYLAAYPNGFARTDAETIAKNAP